MAGFDPEGCTVRGANQLPRVDQEFAGCVIQAPPGMRAFVVVRRHGLADTHQDQVEAAGAGVHMYRDGAAGRNLIDPA